MLIPYGINDIDNEYLKKYVIEDAEDSDDSEDYEFYDPVYKDWDSPRAFVPNSSTRNLMEQIVQILEKHQVQRGFVMTKWCWYINR